MVPYVRKFEAPLVSVHVRGFTNPYGLLYPASETVGLPFQELALGPTDGMVVLRDVVCDGGLVERGNCFNKYCFDLR